MAEERKLQELQMQAAEAGHIDKVERLEFMYKGGPMTSEDQDAYLLGEKKYEPPKEENELEKVSAAPGALLADAVGSKNETWNKLNADPLLMMRMQEQEARKNVTQNPIKMARSSARWRRSGEEGRRSARRGDEEGEEEGEKGSHQREGSKRGVGGGGVRRGQTSRISQGKAFGAEPILFEFLVVGPIAVAVAVAVAVAFAAPRRRSREGSEAEPKSGKGPPRGTPQNVRARRRGAQDGAKGTV